MKPKKNSLDGFIYVMLCLFSCGIVWLIRIIISEAIKQALEESE